MAFTLIPLHSRKYPEMLAFVDDEDAERVGALRWYPRISGNTFYAQSSRWNSNHKKVDQTAMHRFVLGLGAGDPAVDHINGNGLDNRRDNLRLCTDSQNQANRHHIYNPTGTSLYRGVTWNKSCGKWQVTIGHARRQRYIGVFECEVDAALAYDRAALELFGEFARLNFPAESGVI